MNINRRERLWHGVIGFKGRNSFGVEVPRARIPRVARSSQPWDLLRNPFGIKRDRKALVRPGAKNQTQTLLRHQLSGRTVFAACKLSGLRASAKISTEPEA